MDLIILRSNKSMPMDTVPVSSLSHGPGELSVTVEDVSPKDLLGIRRDPHVIGDAPPMPMQLIRALDAPAGTVSAVPAVSWGIQAVGAAGSAYSGAAVAVAVLDTGIDPAYKNLPAFSSVEIETRNFTNDPDGDLDGHGTHCAGTIFGRTTGGCRIGVAPGVGRALIGKVIGQSGGSTESIFKAILWAYQNGAQVISMSLGIDFPAFHQVEFFLARHGAVRLLLNLLL